MPATKEPKCSAGTDQTSTSIAEYLIEQATVDGRLDELLNAAVEDVPVICLGPVGAKPFVVRGVHPLLPPRPYPQELVAVVAREQAKFHGDPRSQEG